VTAGIKKSKKAQIQSNFKQVRNSQILMACFFLRWNNSLKINGFLSRHQPCT